MNAPAEILELIKKNLKNLIRAKASSLVVILGPILVIFLAGLAFDNSNAYAVKIGTYTPDSTPMVSAFLDQLRNQFKVIEYTTEKECVDAIKQTDINTCIAFSPDFTVGIPAKNQITFYVDYSRINLVWTIMQAMTEKVGEQTLQESRTLTKILLDTIEYTKQKVGEERQAIVKLTTENELISKNVQELNAELGDVDLTFDDSAFPVSEITKSKTQVKQWVDNALELGDKGLTKAISFVDAADKIVKQSSAATQTKENLLASFQKSVDDIKKVKDDLSKTKNLTRESFATFEQKLNQLAEAIGNTKGRLQEADTSRQFSLRVLQAVSSLLDESLVSISQVQSALNDIENKISTIQITDPEAITQPIVTSIKPVVQEKTYLNYLFPILVMLIIMFTALLVTPTLIMLEKHSPASFRTYMTPVKDSSYIIANFATASIILFLQVIIILAISSVFFSAQILANIPEAIILLVLINSLFILIGMIIGYIFNSEEAATLAAVTVGAIFLFISDVIIPIESMPEAFAYIASFNPYVLGSSLLRRALLFDISLLTLLSDILVLLGYIAAAALVASGIYMLTKNYTIQQLTKKLAPVLAQLRKKI